MEQGKHRGGRYEVGGIVSLANFVEDHGEAINYDLLTRTTYQLDDVGGVLSWDSLHSFIKYLGTDSALARDLGKSTGWEQTIKTNALLADIYDLLQVINANLCTLGGKRAKKIKPYPRPSDKDENTRKIGKGALPIDELREWIRRKQNV